jgi:hypothetical protein
MILTQLLRNAFSFTSFFIGSISLTVVPASTIIVTETAATEAT